MTSQIFPNGNYTDLTIENLGDNELSMNAFSINEVKRTWNWKKQEHY